MSTLSPYDPRDRGNAIARGWFRRTPLSSANSHWATCVSAKSCWRHCWRAVPHSCRRERRRIARRAAKVTDLVQSVTYVSGSDNGKPGGGRGIRTLDTVSRIHAFQACAFSHSATPPLLKSLEGARSFFSSQRGAVNGRCCAFSHSATSTSCRLNGSENRFLQAIPDKMRHSVALPAQPIL